MSAVLSPLPIHRCDLVIRPLGDDGRHVVKDPASGAYFQLGIQEHFLLGQLDGQRDAASVCRAFEARFGDALSADDLDGFVALARKRGLVENAESRVRNAEWRGDDLPAPRSVLRAPHSKQSILYWRKRFWDPDSFFTRLEPKIRFCWTGSFLMASATCIVVAIFLFWSNRFELATAFRAALRWETALLIWLTLFVVTMLHESAHGLTCKHYGGEVHEIGFLLMFFMPCFYCNVSDAWLFHERSKRLWVTFAGGYFELFLWALAVFVWRLTARDTLTNYVAFIVLSTCGVQTLFNFNPLIKLDGYYLLSDWLEIANLRQRSWQSFAAHLRWLAWGAQRPRRERCGKFLLAFGIVSWVFSLLFLSLMLAALARHFTSQWGVAGLTAVSVLGLATVPRLFQGFTAGEIHKMLLQRRARSTIWLLILAAGAMFARVDDRAGATFQVRSRVRAEVRAPMAGFLQVVNFDEGERVSPGAQLARLEVPDLASRIAQKQAEQQESQARLQMLELGTRPEERADQRERVTRSKAWRDLAQQDLTRSQQVLAEDLERLEKQCAACRVEFEVAQDAHQRAKGLLSQKAMSKEQFQEIEGKQRVWQAHLEQVQAERRARQAKGTMDAEAELARREKELADAEAKLTLLEAGSRPEEIAVEKAHLARLEEEHRYLSRLEERQRLDCPVIGEVTTPRFKEKIGQYFEEGDLLCVVEELSDLEAEITVNEQDVARIKPGQKVLLRARALPFDTFQAELERVAPVADSGVAQSHVILHCCLRGTPAELRPGMTGYARVYTGQRTLGEIVLDRVLRLVRTEFWLW